MDLDQLDLNDATEAEIEREEQQQQQELNDLLMREFNDFDYDDEEDEDESEEEDEEESEEEEEEEEEVSVVLEPSKSSIPLNSHVGHPVATSNPAAAPDAVVNTRQVAIEEEEEDEEEEEEEEEEDEEEEDEEEEEERKESLQELRVSRDSGRDLISPFLHSTLPDQSHPLHRPQLRSDWPDLDSRPRESQPAAADHSGLRAELLSAFPPGPPSTDTSEVFGPRVFGSNRSSGPASFFGPSPTLRSSGAGAPQPVMQDACVEAVPIGQRKLDQLEILYQARGRRIEELTKELGSAKEGQERELRVLKHRLSLAEGEANGARASHQESQRSLVGARSELEQSRKTIQALERGLAEAEREKTEQAERLSAAEAAVETLTAQLVEMTSSQGLRRAREQQQNVLASLKVKHDRSVQELQESLDGALRDLAARDDALRQTRLRAEEAERLRAEAAELHAASSARMAMQLEEAALMAANPRTEAAGLREELAGLRTRSGITETMNRALQEEVKALREEVAMYEAAERCLERNNSSSPSPSPAPSPSAGVSTTAALKRELERCLVNYRSKRQLAERLAAEAREAVARAEEAETALKAAARREEELREAAEAPRSEVERLRSEVERLRSEVERLRSEKEEAERSEAEARARMEEVLASEERLSELNGELQRQISQIFRDFDNDKRESVERVQSTWEQHLQLAKTALRDELTLEFGRERERLVREGLERCASAERLAAETQRELDGAKTEYLQLAASLRTAEEELEASRRTAGAAREEAAREMEQQHRCALEEAVSAAERRMEERLEAEFEARVERAAEAARSEARLESDRRNEERVAKMEEEGQQREAESKRTLAEKDLRCEAAERIRDGLSLELRAVRAEAEAKRQELQERLLASEGAASKLEQQLAERQREMEEQQSKLTQERQALPARLPQPADWDTRLKELKKKLEAEFRARFKDYTLRRDAEAEELHDQLERERLLRLTRWRTQRSASQQTDGSFVSPQTDPRLDASVEKMREQFVDALSRIRGEVLAHVSMSRTRAALALQTELGRTRLRANQRFAEQLRLACAQLEGVGSEDRIPRGEVMAALDLSLAIAGVGVGSSSSSGGATPASSLLFARTAGPGRSLLSWSSLRTSPNVSASWAFTEGKENCCDEAVRRSC